MEGYPEPTPAEMHDLDEANQKMSHDEFVAGLESGTVGFRCMIGEPYRLISGARKAVFNILVMSYTLVPPILIPIWAYHEHDGWLLFGIAVSYIASFSATGRSKLIFLFTMVSLGVWLAGGFSIHQYMTFYYFCALWGYLFFQIAEEFQNTYARQSLKGSPELYEQALSQNWIRITSKEYEDKLSRIVGD
jgi:hypothetical protein